ncbi:hypothetical protein Tco_0144721 [Tanacetum coccineum]
MGTKVTSSLGSVLEKPEIQKLQMQAKIFKENSLNKLNALKSTTQLLERQSILYQQAFAQLFGDSVDTFKFQLSQHMNNLETLLNERHFTGDGFQLSLYSVDKIEKVDQNAAECVDERDALANLIANLTLDIEENKTVIYRILPKFEKTSSSKTLIVIAPGPLEYLSRLNPRASAQNKDAKSHNTTKRYMPIEKSSASKKPKRQIPTGHRIVTQPCIRARLTVNPRNGSIMNFYTMKSKKISECGLLEITDSTEKLVAMNEDQASVFMEMTSVHISSGLVLHQMTSDHNRLELKIHDHSNEPSSSKLVPKVIPLAFKTATS